MNINKIIKWYKTHHKRHTHIFYFEQKITSRDVMVDGWMDDGDEMDGACGDDDSDEERWSDDDDDEGEQMNSVDARTRDYDARDDDVG